MIRITVEDTETGEVNTAEVPSESYLIARFRWYFTAYLPTGRSTSSNGFLRFGDEAFQARTRRRNGRRAEWCCRA